MQVKKVFSVDSKKMCQKPAYVKPKYKTYRELLDLDKPKKLIQHESDDENDDFLQKLMKKEKKKQQQQREKSRQKKQSAKSKNLSQAPSSQANNNQAQQLLVEKKKTSKQNSRLLSARSKHNELNQYVEYLQKRNDTEELEQINLKEKKNTTQNQQHQLSQMNKSVNQNRKQPVKVLIRKKNSSQGNLRANLKLYSDSKTYSKINTEDQLYDTLLKMSQTQANKIIKNNFFTSHKLRKIDGLKQLQRNTHQQRNTHHQRNHHQQRNHHHQKNIHQQRNTHHQRNNHHQRNTHHQRHTAKNTDNLIQTKLNPEKRIIEHTISPQKYIKQNQISYSQRANNYLLKSASSPPVEMLLMMNKSPRNSNQSKYKTAMIARKSLFKTNYQEELFIKSLKKQ